MMKAISLGNAKIIQKQIGEPKKKDSKSQAKKQNKYRISVCLRLKVEKENKYVLDSQRILYGLAILYLESTFNS